MSDNGDNATPRASLKGGGPKKGGTKDGSTKDGGPKTPTSAQKGNMTQIELTPIESLLFFNMVRFGSYEKIKWDLVAAHSNLKNAASARVCAIVFSFIHNQSVAHFSFLNRFAFVKSSKSITCWTRSLRILDPSLRSERLPPSLMMRTVIPPTIRAPSPRSRVCASDLLVPAVAVLRGKRWKSDPTMIRTMRRQLLIVLSLLLPRLRRSLTQSPT